MSLFNTKGELNASSVKDALTTLAKYASVLEAQTPSNFALAGQASVSEDKRDELLSRAMLTQDGKIALAQAMANPIRRNLDYQGMARRCLVVDPLGQGSLPVYHRDVDVQAVVVSSNGAPPESRVFVDAVTVPLFKLASNPTVNIDEAQARRFNVVDRAVQKARQEIMAQEDANVFAALDAAAQVENTLSDLTDSGLTKRDLAELKQQVDGWDNVTTKYFMNIKDFTDILLWGSGGGEGATGGSVDPVTQREILQSGLYGSIWGADIMVSKMVPVGTVYACADPEFVGMMPIRQDITVLPADEPKLMKLGWVVFENIGISIVNPRGVAAGRKSVTGGA